MFDFVVVIPVTIPVKIQCGCGQAYEFEVEPVHGRVPSPIACPSCGADGTAAANETISSSTPSQQPSAPSRGPLRVTLPPRPDSSASSRPAARRSALMLPGEIDRTQVEHEARAKISWGDSPEEVLKYLMIQRFSYEEASAFVQELVQERLSTIRTNGIWKVIIGIILMCVPIAAWFIFQYIGILELKLFALTIIAGLGGLWMAVQGIWMVAAPKTESGDVAQQ